jgi:hypothetical protein
MSEERRRTTDVLEARMEAIEIRMGAVEGKLDAVAQDTAEIRNYWQEARSAFRLFNRIAGVVRYFVKYIVLPVAFLLAALYAWTHNGQLPGWLKWLSELTQ